MGASPVSYIEPKYILSNLNIRFGLEAEIGY